MNEHKSQQFIPHLLQGVDPSQPPLPIDESERQMLAFIDGNNSLADIQSLSQMGLKDLLICAKSLVKKQMIQLVKRTHEEPPAKHPPPPPTAQETLPHASLATVEVKQKQKDINEMAVLERDSKQKRKEAIQKGAAQIPVRPTAPSLATHNPLQAERKPRPTFGMMRSMHATSLSDEIDKLLAPEPPPPQEAPQPAAPVEISAQAQGSFPAGQEPARWQQESPTNEELLAFPEDEHFDSFEQEFAFSTEPSQEPDPFESWEMELPLETDSAMPSDDPFALELLDVPSSQYSHSVQTYADSDNTNEAIAPLHALDFNIATEPRGRSRRQKGDQTHEMKGLTPPPPRAPSMATTPSTPTITARQRSTPPPTMPSTPSIHGHSSLNDPMLAIDNPMQTQSVPQINADLPPQCAMASQMMTGFARVISTFRLYDARNNAVKDALAQVHEQLTHYLNVYKSLTYEVAPWSFLCAGQTVYTNMDREASLAFKLYREGIRELHFEKGFDGEQLAQFFSLLATTQNQTLHSEDDIVTLFWKAQFPHASLLAVEGFQPRGSEQPTPPLQTLFEQLSRAYDEKPEVTKDSESVPSPLRQAYFQEEQQAQSLAQLSVSPAMFIEIPAVACQSMQAEDAGTSWLRLLPDVLQQCEDVILHMPAPTLQEKVRLWLEGCAAALLQGGHIHALTHILQRARVWQEQEDSSALHEVSATIHALFLSEARLKQLFQTLARNKEEQLSEAWVQLFRHSPVDSKPTLLQLLITPMNDSSKASIRHLLINLYNHSIEPFLQRLESAPPDLCIEILACLKMIGTPEAVDAICAQIHHSSPVVQDAVMCMAEFLSQGTKQTNHIRQVVTKLLASDDPLQRNRAYKVMEQSRDGRWATTLHKFIQENHGLDRDELEALFRLAARLNPDLTLPFAASLAHPPGPLGIERGWRKNQRFASIQALAQIGNLKAEEVVRKLIKSTHGETKQLALDAMKELRRGLAQAHDIKETPGHTGLETNAPGSQGPRDSTSQEPLQVGSLDDLHHRIITALDDLDLDRSEANQNQIRDDGASFVSMLHVLLKTAALYEANNEIFARPIQELMDVQERLFGLLDEVAIIGLEEQFYIHDLRIRMQGANIRQACLELCDEFGSLSMGGLAFKAPLEANEWRHFVQLYVGKEQPKATHRKELQQQLQQSGLSTKIEALSEVTYQVGPPPAKQDLLQLYAHAMAAGKDIWQAAAEGKSADALPIRRTLQNIVDYFAAHPGSRMEVLAFADPMAPLKTHSINVAILSMRIGQSLGLDRNALVDLGSCAFFHDLGHLVPATHGLPEQLAHQSQGAAWLLQQPFHPTQVKRIAATLEHHQAFTPPEDLTSPPRPFLYSRITRIADTYDSLTTPALVGKQLSPAQVIQRIASDPGQMFDPNLSQALINCVGHYPIGTLVELDDNALAIAMGTRPYASSFERPMCLLVRSGQRNTKAGQTIDLDAPEHMDRKVQRFHTPTAGMQPRRTLMEHLKRNAWD